MSGKILIVEDDHSISSMIYDYLASENFSADIFSNGTGAVRAFSASPDYALALIDLMLPDISGVEVIRSIRQTSTLPIIIITARDSDTDKSMGLNSGADDYVVKPFSLIELSARIRAHIRRAVSYNSPPHDDIIRLRDLEINLSRRTAQASGTVLNLTRTEFDILSLLAASPGQAFSKERLYSLVWKEPDYGNEHVLNTHINRLRAKLKSACTNGSGYIQTLWGIGYKLNED